MIDGLMMLVDLFVVSYDWFDMFVLLIGCWSIDTCMKRFIPLMPEMLSQRFIYR